MLEVLNNLETVIIAIGVLLAAAAAIAAETKSKKDDMYVSTARRYWRQFLRVIKVLGYEGRTDRKEN